VPRPSRADRLSAVPPQPQYADRPPWTRPGFVVAALLVALIVVAGLVVALWPSPNRHPAADPPAPSPGAANTNPGANPTGEPGNPLPTTVPTVAPPDVTWQLVHQVALPVSRSAGPTLVTDTTASGYAHTPVGALVAAAQISSRSALHNGRAMWEATLTRQFVPSADRDTLLAALRTQPDTPADPGELSQLSGFRFISYTPDTAVVGLVDRTPGATAAYYITTLTLLWHDGDWRMVAPPGGSWTAASQKLTDQTGVVVWGAR
jgi:hypothetical protein